MSAYKQRDRVGAVIKGEMREGKIIAREPDRDEDGIRAWRVSMLLWEDDLVPLGKREKKQASAYQAAHTEADQAKAQTYRCHFGHMGDAR